MRRHRLASLTLGLTVVAVAGLPALTPSASASTTRSLAQPAFRAGIRPFASQIVAGKSIVVDPRGTRYPKGDAPVSHTIIFGDGSMVKSSGALKPVRHTYRKTGTFKVTLVVTDRHRKTVRTTRTIKVVKATTKPVVVTVPVTTPTTTPKPVTTPTPVTPTPSTAPLSGTVHHDGAGVSGVLVVAVPFTVSKPTTVTGGGGTTTTTTTSDSRPELSTTTAADGSWAFPAAQPGSYEIYVDANPDTGALVNPAYAPTAASATVVAGAKAVYHAVLDDPAAVTGTVSGPGGPVAATVTLFQELGQSGIVVTAKTTAAGAYTFGGLVPTANTYVDYLPASDLLTENIESPDLSSKAGQTATQNETLTAAGAITGTVVTSSGPLTQAVEFSYTATDSDGNTVASGEGETAANGAIDLGHLPAGSYTITVNDPSEFDSNPEYANVTSGTLTVTTGARSDAGTLTLPLAGFITVTISEAGSPVADSYVSAAMASGPTYYGTVNSDGTYSIGGLLAGTYTVTATDSDNQDTGTLPGVMVTAGATTKGEDVTLVPGSGSAPTTP